MLRRSTLAVEVEALGQGTVARLVGDTLDALLPEPLDIVRKREHRQRGEAKRRIDTWEAA